MLKNKTRDARINAYKKEPLNVGISLMEDEEKIYDIRDVLNKAMERGEKPEDYRQLNNTQYDILKR